jgi:hypothetical protein
MQYFDWTNGAHLDWSLLARNTTRGGPGGQLDWSSSLTGPPARLVYAHFVVLRKDQSWCSPSLKFLPPYSPDYNPIELTFSVLKA